ncbi:hypothetical protein CHLRE_10g439800v5 [Chlamydomonas reinhardtii]|uniref:Uncharacterized protein n=1 Tax=Chlamydomonas reinhardtii TaxID=3055 RepID=A0A2K3DAF5_CHLRE|nr:uncharacterized protein CHLRE_10g439800v5 [Chlamydomonas reinhardtii]PNW77511.1 hypothetical protein CHLRE_10g439800v5 [Chlamydomonas reinhardtii]
MDNAKEARAEVTLLDVLRILDVKALDRMFKTRTHCDFSGARLACRALRAAHDLAVRLCVVRVSQRTALNWRPGQLSPLALFPHCTSLRLELVADKEDLLRSLAEDEEEPVWFSQEALARMALLGTSAEARARLTNLGVSIPCVYGSGTALDIAGVLAALAPDLPALQTVDATDGDNSLLGMGAAGDHVRSTILHSTLSTHTPQLRELTLPSAPGLLRGVAALAGCARLQHLHVSCLNDRSDAVLLRAEEVAGLSALPALKTLHLCCHDPSPGGDNLASLLGARRPPALRSIRLYPSVAWNAGAPERQLGLSAITADFVPGQRRIEYLSTDHAFFDSSIDNEFNAAVVDRLAGVLLAAVASVPRDCDGIGCLRLQTYMVSEPGIRRYGAGEMEDGEEDADEQGPVGLGAGALEARLARYLGPGGRLPQLLARCTSVGVDFLDASEAVSAAAVCAVQRVLGLPTKELMLHHGSWQPRAADPAVGSCASSTRDAMQLLQRARQPGGHGLQLGTAGAEGVLLEAMERLWRVVANAPDTAAGHEQRTRGSSSSSSSSSGNSCVVMMRAVSPLARPPAPLAPRVDYRDVDREACASMAQLLDALLTPAAPAVATGAAAAVQLEAASSSGAVTKPGHRLDADRPFASVPCAGVMLVECAPTEDAAALAEQLNAAGAAVGAGGGGAGTTVAAVVLPTSLGACWDVCGDYTLCVRMVKLAVLTVLLELWVGAEAQSAADAAAASKYATGACGGSGSGGGSGAPRHGLHGAALDRVRRLLELDASAAALWRLSGG